MISGVSVVYRSRKNDVENVRDVMERGIYFASTQERLAVIEPQTACHIKAD